MSAASSSKIAALTFDDAVANHATFVAPQLKRRDFGATFYITEFLGEGTDRFDTDKRQYLTWEQIRALDADGFEIGNHTGTHAILRGAPIGRIETEIDRIETRCREHRITPPQTFAYPCGETDDHATTCVRSRGYRLARITGDRPYLPDHDDPMLVPSFVITESDPDCWARALRVTETAGGVCVLTLHGVPDHNHPWVTLSPECFLAGLDLLQRGGWKVVALRDLAP